MPFRAILKRRNTMEAALDTASKDQFREDVYSGERGA